MKKIVLFLTALALIVMALPVFAEPVADTTEQPDMGTEIAVIAGTVLEVNEGESLLIDAGEQGEVLALIGEDTVMEIGEGAISVGDYVYIDYDGKMTRSIPAQITAITVRRFMMEGDVAEVYAEDNAVLLNVGENEQVYVRLPESWAGQQVDAVHMKVYFDGVMTMSLPGQINAGLVIPGYAMQGEVTQINRDYIMIGEGEQAVQVNFEEGTLPQCLNVGDIVRAIYDGKTTRSLPPQIFATEIIKLNR